MMTLIVNLAIAYFLLFPIIFVHELGHAFTAKALDFKVFYIKMGYGKRLAKFRLFDIPIELNRYPMMGITVAFPKTKEFFKTRIWFYILGGPITHVIQILMCWLFLGNDSFLNQIYPIAFVTSISPLTALIYSNTYLFLISIIPMKINSSIGSLKNDGLNLLSIPFQKTNETTDLETVAEEMKALEMLREERFNEALLFYQDAIGKKPEKYLINVNIGLIELMKGNFERANLLFTETLETLLNEKADEKTVQEFNDANKNILYNNIAYVNALLPSEELLEIADEYSKIALNSSPNFVNYIGTRGAVLIRLGKYPTGINLLERAFKLHSEDSPRSANALFIAIGEAKMGNKEKSLEWLETARKIHSTHYFFAIAEKEIHEINSEMHQS
jgi:tetratricopeptide (TPR) repeat protein